ncbi:hypothetical protein IFM89_032576, partial [Coptis chinensis]
MDCVHLLKDVNCVVSESSESDEFLEKEHAGSPSVWMDSWIAMKAVIRVQTFQIIVLQGIVGSLPWTAMVFFIMRFELIGFNNNNVAGLLCLFAIGCAMGSFLGGVIADKMSRIYPHSGRIIWFTVATTLFFMGLMISWCATCANNPIFAEVVPTKHRTMIYAFDRAFEGSAAPIVGILSEKIYGYDPKFVNPLFGSKQEAFALSRGLFSVMALPFGLCSLFYSPLYLTYKRDHESARLASLKEQESIHDT